MSALDVGAGLPAIEPFAEAFAGKPAPTLQDVLTLHQHVNPANIFGLINALCKRLSAFYGHF
jgi:hypothetical protein